MTGGAGGSKAYLPSFSVVYMGKDYRDNWESVFGSDRAEDAVCECGSREKMPDNDCGHWRCAKCWTMFGPI